MAILAAFSAATVFLALSRGLVRAGALLEETGQGGSLSLAAKVTNNVTVEASPEVIAASARAGLEKALDKNSVSGGHSSGSAQLFLALGRLDE